MKPQDIRTLDLGIVDYREACLIQKRYVREVLSEDAVDYLLLLEHKPVITFGRVTDENNILDREYFSSLGYDIVRSERGGRITCHMPGQLVIYPILDLRRIKKDISYYIDLLEICVVRALERLGVKAYRIHGKRGVWTDLGKIAFIGVKGKSWVTCHGVAVNINNDTEPYKRINPCGVKGVRVTSARLMLARPVDMKRAKHVFSSVFRDVFTRERKESCHGIET
ncbi:MAG: lipoyl(octanoyl) transferase LipB [Candidatus Omnitrophica bacterium]|nr:lipoyl(octanoyl) transferase LipB [Candidatus Omnitrophota bacterium]